MKSFLKSATIAWCGIGCLFLGVQIAAGQTLTPRPPAVPLVTHTPYFSIWSRSEQLTDRHTSHWTGQVQRLAGLIRIDGKTYRVIGPEPEGLPALEQTRLELTPTRSIYQFTADGIRLTLSFVSPVIASDLELVSRPVTYVVWEVETTDGRSHDVQLMLGLGAEAATSNDNEAVVWSRESVAGLTALKIGTADQPVLGHSGDWLRINWGHGWLASPASDTRGTAGTQADLLKAFIQDGKLPNQLDTDMPRAANDRLPSLALVTNLGAVSSAKRVYQMLAYDEIKAISYFGQPLKLWWARNGVTAGQMLQTAAEEFELVLKRCEAFDQRLMADAEKVGGAKYAYLCALAYRQAMAGNILAADDNNMPLFFNKEISSNGMVQTVDVIYPMSPMVLLLSPALTKAMLMPVLDYTASKLWPFPYACHDLGIWPLPEGNVYGGMQPGNDADRMPVEESANMLLMIAAVAYQQDGDIQFVRPYWSKLRQWADYLAKHGIDPVEQLSTDDFTGHLARNANLSVKAILGIGAMSWLCEQAGDMTGKAKYRKLAEEGVQQWLKLADAGDHYALAFEQPDTWSLKYNLVWDRILKLNLFPSEVAQREVAYYLKQLNRFGVPLDSRQEETGMTKADWLVWSATLNDAKHFHEMVDPLFDFYNQVPQRNPMTDWFRTTDGHEIGFVARPVMGGVFIPFLYNETLWDKWADAADPLPGREFSRFPTPPTIARMIVPVSDIAPSTWRYVLSQPVANWMMPDFDDSSWRRGTAGFGTSGTPGARVNTRWDGTDIWIRRTVTIPDDVKNPIWLYVHHDEKATIYLNGQLATTLPGYVTNYKARPITNQAAIGQLKPGAEVTIAVHCQQTSGGQYIDVGLVEMNTADG